MVKMMSIISKCLVNIPDDSGVVIKKAGKKGEKYVYKQTLFFRNEAGRPRNTAKIIGKFDAGSGKMYPNGNYFELFNVHPVLPDVSVWDYGYSYLVQKCARDIELLNCLKQAFGDLATNIIIMAAYIIREGNAMDGIDDWQRRNYFSEVSELLTSQSTSRIFANITLERRMKFFKSWVKTALTSGSVCYDVTSISSYSQEMISVERGYNRDGDDLAQFNLGMFCNENEKTPLYYNRYSGSLTDKTNLKYVLDNAKSIGIEKVKIVLDGGFWSEEALRNLNASCETFTVGMPSYLEEAGRIFEELGANMAQYSNELHNHHIYCVEKIIKIHGISGKALLYFDSQSHVIQCNDLSEYIERLKAELSALKRFPKSKLQRYSPYFTLSKHENDSGFDFAVDIIKVDELRRRKGYFQLFTTDLAASPAKILYYYRAKDADEKIFAQIKVDMDGNRVRTHNEVTADGKTFVTFIACVLRAYMLRKLSSYLSANSTSMKKVFNQLSNIVVLADSNSKFHFAQALTKKQKNILACFGEVNDIKNSLP
jgi:transposase